MSTPMRRVRSGCCARAARGHPAAAPPTSVMNSRRLTGRPLKQRVLPYHAEGCIVHHGKFGLLMSALGQKRTFEYVRAMSALPPKADIGTGPRSTQQLRQLSDIRRDPLRPTLMRLTSKLPSVFGTAAITVKADPGSIAFMSATSYRTIGTFGVTMIFFSPSLYLTVMTGPSTPATLVPTVPFVIVPFGAPSHGRDPSAVPRIDAA